MRLFGSERMMGIFNSLGFPEGEAIQHKMLSGAVEKAQMKIESNNYGIRKNLLEYDAVMNEQREIIYGERRRVLNGENMKDSILKMLRDTIDKRVRANLNGEQNPEEWDMTALAESILSVVPMTGISWNPKDYSGETVDSVSKMLQEKAEAFYEAKEKEFPEAEHLREVERVVLLRAIDQRWMNHIDDMEQLRQGIGLQAYGQKDPLVEYKFAGYDMFDEMTENISSDTVRILCHIRIEQKVERKEVAKVTGTNKDDSGPKQPVRRKEGKVYPNDPCPCGSGKKYKQCCGRNK